MCALQQQLVASEGRERQQAQTAATATAQLQEARAEARRLRQEKEERGQQGEGGETADEEDHFAMQQMRQDLQVLAPPPLPSRLLCQLDGCPACAVRVELRECGDYEEGGSRSVVRAQRVLEEVPVEQRLAEEFRLGSGEGG